MKFDIVMIVIDGGRWIKGNLVGRLSSRVMADCSNVRAKAVVLVGRCSDRDVHRV